MASNNTTFSSAQLRERDQRLCERFQKEKGELERKLQKIKYASEQSSKDLFDAVNRARRLATSLGFQSEYEAQVFIDSADNEVNLRESAERIQTLEAQLRCEKQQVSILQAKLNMAQGNNLNEIQAEVEMLKRELRESRSQHKEDMERLQGRYDQLQDVRDRAAQRFKADYKKWQSFHNWLFSEIDHHHKHRNEAGISQEEKKRRDIASIMRKRQKMIEMGPDLGEIAHCHDLSMTKPPPVGGTSPEDDKENSGMPQPQSLPKKRRSFSDASNPRSLSGLNTLKSVTNFAPPSSSPTMFFTAGQTVEGPHPLVFQTLFENTIPKQEPGLSQSPSLARSFKRSYAHIPSSSDTEDDSQAVCIPAPNTRSGKPSMFKVPAPPASTSRLHDNGDRLATSLPTRPSCASEPRRKLDFLQAEPMRGDERPLKIRRLSGDSVPSSSLKLEVDEDSTPLAMKGKGKERENDMTPMTIKDKSQKPSNDYSTFKGRGRYGHTQNTEKTINALYTINTAQNEGRTYQYDEVVRTREQRKKMHGGDCECCRDYYENVGPLPPRLQQPLWRSPTKSPSKYNRGRSLSPSPRETDDVDSHRKAISRHRHTWARAKTPPGYWDIGFPDTQQVGDINQKAKEMQKRKLDEVEKEAERDSGRFRKRH